MTDPGVYPKINGDILYAEDVNMLLRRDGSLSLNNNWNVGGYSITNIKNLGVYDNSYYTTPMVTVYNSQTTGPMVYLRWGSPTDTYWQGELLDGDDGAEIKVSSISPSAGHSGVVMDNPLYLNFTPTQNNHAVNKQYVDSLNFSPINWKNQINFSRSNVPDSVTIVATISNVSVPSGGTVLISFSGSIDFDGDPNDYVSVYCYREGTQLNVQNINNDVADNSTIPFGRTFYDTPGSGTYTYTIRAESGFATADIENGIFSIIVFK